jgi:hypothetical protein
MRIHHRSFTVMADLYQNISQTTAGQDLIDWVSRGYTYLVTPIDSVLGQRRDLFSDNTAATNVLGYHALNPKDDTLVPNGDHALFGTYYASPKWPDK